MSIGTPPILMNLLLPRTHPRGPAAGPDCLHGVAISPGHATGRARLVDVLADDVVVTRGDVVVVRALVPALAPFLARASAIVADVGSLAAHTATLAREFGVPTVGGLGVATQVIREGDILAVDGTRGTVQILDGRVSVT